MFKKAKQKYKENAAKKLEAEEEIVEDKYVIFHPRCMILQYGYHLNEAVTKARDYLALNTSGDENVVYVARLDAVVTKRTEVKTEVKLLPHEEDDYDD